jgi:Ca-activated chloride channel homolog
MLLLGAVVAQATFSSRTVVVVVPVSVTDERGRSVEGLSKEQFHLYDEGQLQSITTFAGGEAAVTIGLVVDRSASMRLKLSAVTDALERFARSARPGDELFLTAFNERAGRATFTTGPFTSDALELRTAVAALRAVGATALHDAVIDGSEQLRHIASNQKALVVISDGRDNASHQTFAQALSVVREVGALVYTIGLSTDPDDRRSRRELSRLSRESGGTAYFLPTVEDVSTALDRITRDLRTQYLLGFVPGTSANSPRRVRVEVDAPGHGKITIRSRASYALPR